MFKVQLDAVDVEEKKFQVFIIINLISYEALEFGEYEFTGTKEALEKMIDLFWNDEDLKDFIEEA